MKRVTVSLLLTLSLIYPNLSISGQSKTEKAANSKSSDVPIFQRFPNGSEFHELPVLPVLTLEQESQLHSAINEGPNFSPYIYSGCHDRAHALWMLLPEELRSRTAKVWVFSPSALTLAFIEPLTLPAMGTESPKWTYHVALVYRSKSGIKVVDPAMSDWKISSKLFRDWVNQIKKPYGSIMTLLTPRLYLFYALAGLDNYPANNKPSTVVNNGQFFECVGACRTNRNIEEALARDDIAFRLSKETTCKPLHEIWREPGKLLTKLKETHPSQECTALVSAFADRTSYWNNILWRSAD